MTPNDELEQAYRQGYEQARSTARELLKDAVQFITMTDNVQGLKDVDTWLHEAADYLTEG